MKLLLVTCYLLLAVVITWPLITKFNSSIYGEPTEYVLTAAVPYSTPVRTADSFSRIWKFWWTKEADRQGISADFCPLLGISGVDLTDEFPDLPILETVGKYLTILTNEVFAYNFLILLSFPLAGLAMYLLAFYLTKNRWASALAGFIFAFSPLHQRMAFEWLGMAQWHWLVLYILFLVKLEREKKTVFGLLAGLLFAVTFYENYYFGYFAVFFTFFFVLFRLVQSRVLPWRPYLLMLAVILVLTLPISTTFLKESGLRAAGEEGKVGGFARQEWDRFALSARPWYYLWPDVKHPVLGGLTQKMYDWLAKKPPYFLTQPFYPREHSLYLGWTTLILSAFAALRPTRRVWLFLFLAIVMMIFSAPPYATISLHKIYFPSHFLYQFFPMFRSYARFGVLVLLCVSILAAFGAKVLLEKIKNRKLLPIVYCLLPLFIFFEFLNFPPFNNIELQPLPVYEDIAQQPGDFAILVYPPDNSNTDLLAQRTHQKRFLNPKGRTPSEVSEILDHLNEAETVGKLRGWGVRYIVLRGDSSLGLESHYTLVQTYQKPPVYLFEVR